MHLEIAHNLEINTEKKLVKKINLTKKKKQTKQNLKNKNLT